ncbi:MAG: hypothetical protein KDD62_07715, partial [Bdellovibrionales bacterium]|nr:hypothetical protein [Bdellovibrionales bacterium]
MNSVTQSQSGQKQFEAALFSHSLFKDPRPPKTADAVAPSSPFTNTPEYEPNLAEHINEIRQAVRRACVRQRRTGTLDLSSAYESLQKLVKDPIPLPESNLELAEQIGMFHRVMTEYCAPIGRYFHLQIQNVMSPLGDLENAAGVTEALLDNNQWRRYPTVAGDVWLNNISLLSSSLSYMGFTDRNFAFPCRRSAQLVGEGLYEKLEADDEDQLKSAKSLLKLLHAFGVSKQDFGSLYGVPRSHYTQIQIAADYLYVRRLGQIKNHPQMQNEIVNNKIAGLQLLPESSPLLAFDAQSHRYSASMELGVVARIMSGQIGGALREIQHHLSGPHPERAFLSALSYICDLQMT